MAKAAENSRAFGRLIRELEVVSDPLHDSALALQEGVRDWRDGEDVVVDARVVALEALREAHLKCFVNKV